MAPDAVWGAWEIILDVVKYPVLFKCRTPSNSTRTIVRRGTYRLKLLNKCALNLLVYETVLRLLKYRGRRWQMRNLPHRLRAMYYNNLAAKAYYQPWWSVHRQSRNTVLSWTKKLESQMPENVWTIHLRIHTSLSISRGKRDISGPTALSCLNLWHQ